MVAVFPTCFADSAAFLPMTSSSDWGLAMIRVSAELPLGYRIGREIQGRSEAGAGLLQTPSRKSQYQKEKKGAFTIRDKPRVNMLRYLFICRDLRLATSRYWFSASP